MSEPAPYSTWRHLRSGGTFTVLGVARCSTNGSEEDRSVIYVSHTFGELLYRQVSEFMDGRFVPVTVQRQ